MQSWVMEVAVIPAAFSAARGSRLPGCRQRLLQRDCAPFTSMLVVWNVSPYLRRKQNSKVRHPHEGRAQNTEWHHHNFLFLQVSMAPGEVGGGNLHALNDWRMVSQLGPVHFLLFFFQHNHNKTIPQCSALSWLELRKAWPNMALVLFSDVIHYKERKLLLLIDAVLCW